MRGLVGAAGIVFAVLIVSIGAARWLGQRYGEPPFPLPDDRGCWDGLCVVNISPTELARQLSHHSGIRADSVECNSPQPSGECSAFRFSTTGGADFLLQRGTDHYNLALGVNGGPSPLQLGDVIAALGPPGELTVWTGVVILTYPRQNLQITVRPTLKYQDQVHLAPTNAVLNLEVARDGLPGSFQLASGPLSVAWHGVGIYRMIG